MASVGYIYIYRYICMYVCIYIYIYIYIYILNKNTEGVKKGEANQKQQLSDYNCD